MEEAKGIRCVKTVVLEFNPSANVYCGEPALRRLHLALASGPPLDYSLKTHDPNG